MKQKKSPKIRLLILELIRYAILGHMGNFNLLHLKTGIIFD